MILIRICACLSIAVMAGCSHPTPGQRWQDFVNNPKNKIVQSIRVGGVNATAKWLPVQPGHKPSEVDDRQQVKSAQHETYCYFLVRFESANGGKLAEDKVVYLDFDIQNDFSLLCAGDSLPAVLCQRMETGIAGRYEYMVSFYSSNGSFDKNDFTLIYKDKIFGMGIIGFGYSQKDIRKIPGV